MTVCVERYQAHYTASDNAAILLQGNATPASSARKQSVSNSTCRCRYAADGIVVLVCLAPMEVGINFFPDVRPEEKAADVYFDECLRLAAQADELGFHH